MTCQGQVRLRTYGVNAPASFYSLSSVHTRCLSLKLPAYHSVHLVNSVFQYNMAENQDAALAPDTLKGKEGMTKHVTTLLAKLSGVNPAGLKDAALKMTGKASATGAAAAVEIAKAVTIQKPGKDDKYITLAVLTALTPFLTAAWLKTHAPKDAETEEARLAREAEARKKEAEETKRKEEETRKETIKALGLSLTDTVKALHTAKRVLAPTTTAPDQGAFVKATLLESMVASADPWATAEALAEEVATLLLAAQYEKFKAPPPRAHSPTSQTGSHGMPTRPTMASRPPGETRRST